MEEPEVDVAENDPSDDLGQALHNVQADCESETERLKFQKLLEDHQLSVLPTQMYKLHQHYMRAMADCIFMQGAKIKDDDFLWGRPLYG